MSRVIFVHGGQGSSTYFGTSQISRALTGSEEALLFKSDSCRDKIIIAFKKMITKINLQKLKDGNNKIILDVLDWIDYDKYSIEANKNEPNFFPEFNKAMVDGYIVNSHKMKLWWQKNIDESKPIFVMPRHWDSRFSDVHFVKYPQKPHIYFSGQKSWKNWNCLYVDRLIEDGLLHDKRSSERYFKDLPLDGCQISLRMPGSWEFSFKPASKLFTAAAIGSPIITTMDWSVEEILPDDYPYALKSADYDTVVEGFKFVKETYLAEPWFKAKEILQAVKAKTTVEEISKRYLDIESYFS